MPRPVKFFSALAGAVAFVAWPLLGAWGREPAPLEGKLTIIAYQAPPPWQDKKRNPESPEDRAIRLGVIAYAHAIEAESPTSGVEVGL